MTSVTNTRGNADGDNKTVPPKDTAYVRKQAADGKMIFIYKGRRTKTWRSYKTASFIRKEEWVYTKIFILAEGRTVWRETASLNDTDGLIVLQQSVQKTSITIYVRVCKVMIGHI